MVLWSAIGLLVSIGSTFRPGITLHCSDYKQPPPLPPALLYTIDWSAQRKRADLNCPATLQLSRYTETKALELSGTEPTHSRFDPRFFEKCPSSMSLSWNRRCKNRQQRLDCGKTKRVASSHPVMREVRSPGGQRTATKPRCSQFKLPLRSSSLSSILLIN